MVDAFANAEPELIQCPVGFSFFFDLIQKECGGRNPATLHRICSLMRKMGVSCFIRETLDLNTELKQEQEDATARTGGAVSLTAVRLSFFRDGSLKVWADAAGKELLGYAVVVTITLPDGQQRCYIVEAIVRLPTLWVDSGGQARPEVVTNHYVHCCRDFNTTIGTKDQNFPFTLRGSYFCQQNDLTHVCAHAALRMGINSSAAYHGGKLTNQRINQLLGINHTSKKVGKYPPEKESAGVAAAEIRTVVEKMGWRAQVASFVSNPAIDYEDFIYPIIESGHPVILGVYNPRTAHVLAVVGHTLNTDRWSPEARHGYGAFPIAPYISTSAWADHFIVNDDNFGMYVTVSTESIRNLLVPKHNPNLHAAFAIGLVPSGVTIAGYSVEQATAMVATKVLEKVNPTAENRWLGHLKDSRRRLVCRTFLTEKKTYILSLEKTPDDQGNLLVPAEVALLQKTLPDEFWLTEISVPNLYTGNKRKLGDIMTLANPTVAQYETNEMIQFCWLPGIAFSGPALAGPAQGWSLFGHVPLLRGTAPRHTLEW
jgi:hypothetical protein